METTAPTTSAVRFSAGGVIHADNGHGLPLCGKTSPYGDAPQRQDGWTITCKRCQAARA